MTDTQADSSDLPPKKSRLPLFLSLFLAILGAAGGFYLSWSGMIFGHESHTAEVAQEVADPLADVVYIAMDPLIISLQKPSQSAHLTFRAQLEVPSQYKEDVEKLLPRVTDVLNGYLRAIEIQDLESSSILVRLRSQMLHRIALVVGPERVNDLLIMEFVFT